MVSIELLDIIAPAIVAGFMIAAIHGPLGVEVLRRRIIFIDLAIAQIACLFVVLVDLFTHEGSWVLRQFVAMGAALLAAWLFGIIEKILPKEQEAIIGACFVLSASGVLLALANHPHGDEAMQDILSGQLIFVSWQDILAFALVYTVAILLWFGWPQVRRGPWFYAIFAVVVTASVQLVGLYVVFASLILPALAVNTLLTGRTRRAILCGWFAIVVGIGISVVSDLPTGPLIVFVYAAIACLHRLIVYKAVQRAP
jgi:zinc/manganese transport system permease protein